MKVTNIYNQIRRDCWCDIVCEKCGKEETDKYAYDDRNFWDNVIPNKECAKCGMSTNSLGLTKEQVPTRYMEHEVI